MTPPDDDDQVSAERVLRIVCACARLFRTHSTEEVLGALALLTALTCEEGGGVVEDDGDSPALRWADFERMARGLSPMARLAVMRAVVADGQDAVQ